MNKQLVTQVLQLAAVIIAIFASYFYVTLGPFVLMIVIVLLALIYTFIVSKKYNSFDKIAKHYHHEGKIFMTNYMLWLPLFYLSSFANPESGLFINCLQMYGGICTTLSGVIFYLHIALLIYFALLGIQNIFALLAFGNDKIYEYKLVFKL